MSSNLTAGTNKFLNTLENQIIEKSTFFATWQKTYFSKIENSENSMKIENCKLKIIKNYVLPVSVFITGACVLIVEITATRILSPFFGNTIFTVSSVISVILAALSAGYYFGGRLADKQPSFFYFFGIILISGIVLMAFHSLGIFVLPVLSFFMSLSQGPLISSLLLFFLPAFLLGAVSPYAVKLQSINFPEQGVGTVAGNIFFWSTLGSIGGSLMAGFWLIPFFGVNQIIIATAAVLFILGFSGIFFAGRKKYLVGLFLFFIFLTGVSFYSSYAVSENVLYSEDGVYEKIVIYDSWLYGRPARFLKQDLSSSGAMFLNSDDQRDLAYEYTEYYSLYKIFNPEIKDALFIGGGAYSAPKALLKDNDEVKVDVSEIEPSLFELAKKYFNLQDSPRLQNFSEDGRRLLSNSEKSYDLIFSDVYYSIYSIPPHFTTKEFFEISKVKLNPNGIFIANMIGNLSRQEPSLIMSEIKTFKSVFENSYFFAVKSPKITSSQNIIFVGYNSDKSIDFNSNSLKDKLIDIGRFDLSGYPILTDNYSPVEYLTGKVLEKISRGDNFFDGQEIMALISQQLRYGYRYPTAEGHEKVKNFIVAEMKALADDVIIQSWVHSEPTGESYELTNIMARFYPEKTNRIILATHYDSQKFSFMDFWNKNQPSPGANNSASGTAVLLDAARLLSNFETHPDVGVDIIFFDGEEGEESQKNDFTKWKALGSEYFTDHLSDIYKNKKPTSGVVLDMVCDKDLKILKESSSVKNAPLQTQAFWDIASEVSPKIFLNEESQEIGDDHTYLNSAGIPSFLIIDFDYPYWATTNDTTDKCSAESLKAVETAIWNYIYN